MASRYNTRLRSKTPTAAPPEPHTPSTPSSTDSNKLELDEEVQARFESGIWGRAAQDSDGEAPPPASPPAELGQEDIFSQHAQDQDDLHHPPPSGSSSEDDFLLDKETLAKSRTGVFAAAFGQVPTSTSSQDSPPPVESEGRSRQARLSADVSGADLTESTSSVEVALVEQEQR